jgi:hypothetical protein
VVAWTDAAPPAVEGALLSLGLAHFRLAPRAAGGAEVVDRVRSLSGH